MVAFGHNLARVRGDLGLSQERAAWMAGLAPYTYQKFEKGESRPGTPANPRLRNALAISQALDVWLWDLLPALPDLTQGR
ncbi:helix-turn-helix transcriptional regulator [Nocardioides sp. BGMRC 2183]|nr:helix-turn-helix transcriptional regulator [Nocardioides sp. BGMRC 2183]